MKRYWLWMAAILVLMGPCYFMAGGQGKVAKGAATMTLISQMRMQATVFEAQHIEGLLMGSWPPDAQAVIGLINRMNAEIKSFDSPEAREQIRKEGINPDAMPKPVPWVLAPQKAKRTLSLAVDADKIVILGWGIELDKPIFEKTIKMRGPQ